MLVAVAAGISAAYLGLVSSAFPGTWAGFGPAWSMLCPGWGVAVAALGAVPARLQPRQLVGEVVEPERAL